MTLQLPLSTRQALVNAMAQLMDSGGPSPTGSVSFIDGVGTQIALINSSSDTPPSDPFFGAADNGDPTTAAAMTTSDIEDTTNTIAGTIEWAVFLNKSGTEQWRSDVAPANADIIMANPATALNDPVRLSTYQVESTQVN